MQLEDKLMMEKCKSKINQFLFLFRGFWKCGKLYVVVSCVLAILVNVISVFVSTCMNRDIINGILNQKTFFSIILIAIFYQVLYIVVNVVDTFTTMCFLNKQFVRISAELNKTVFYKALKIKSSNLDDPRFYDDYSWTVKEYVRQSDFTIELIKKILVSLFSLITLFSVLSTGSWFVFLVTCLYLVIIVPLDFKLSKLNINKQKEMQQHNRKLDYVQRTFCLKDFAQVLKITLMPMHLFNWYDSTVIEKMASQDKYNRKISFVSVVQVAIQHICTLGIMCFYIWQIFEGTIGVGDFVATVSAATLLRKTFYNFTTYYKSFNEISYVAEKICNFFDSEIEDQQSNGVILTEKSCSIQLCNVTFSYPNTDIGVSNLDMNIRPGQKVAIVGTNGAGKTTLVKLLLKLYEPDKGNILINGMPLNDYNLVEYRLSTGVALQETNIFALGIRENLSRYQKMEDTQIDEVLDVLSMNRVIEQSKHNYSVSFLREFDSNGVELSGGERQKVALGALLNKKFPLLILDEPTSALDPIAEFELNQIMVNKSLESTTIIISHRLSAIKNVDYIYVMDNGKIVEHGTHQTLLENKSFYYDMYMKQVSLYS